MVWVDCDTDLKMEYMLSHFTLAPSLFTHSNSAEFPSRTAISMLSLDFAYQTPSFRSYAEITCSDLPERTEWSADVRHGAVRLYPPHTYVERISPPERNIRETGKQ
jgi:hypothetical protein